MHVTRWHAKNRQSAASSNVHTTLAQFIGCLWNLLPSVPCHCWFGIRKNIWPVKIKQWCAGLVICLWSSWWHCHSTICGFIEIEIGLACLMPAYPGCSGKEAVKRVPVCLVEFIVLKWFVQPRAGAYWSCWHLSCVESGVVLRSIKPSQLCQMLKDLVFVWYALLGGRHCRVWHDSARPHQARWHVAAWTRLDWAVSVDCHQEYPSQAHASPRGESRTDCVICAEEGAYRFNLLSVHTQYRDDVGHGTEIV